MNNNLSHFTNATVEDLVADPKKYGAPTFEEFCKNREKFFGRWDDAFVAVDKGSQNLDKIVKGYKYEVIGVECNSLEQVETRCRDVGIDLEGRGFDIKPRIIDLGGRVCEVIVNFVPKQRGSSKNASSYLSE